MLVPEPMNPYDANAIAVQIDDEVVGYLSRATAQEYLPGLKHVMSVRGGHVALRGVIVGGGYYDDGPGRLGVWLEHDPADFGVASASFWSPGPPGHSRADGVMRTGFTEAWPTDAEDDSYDLSWFNSLPEADRPAIAKLRELVAAESDPIDRHFQFAELEARLYHSRDLYESALAEYDEACARHDVEMESICEAFMTKWGKVPLLDTYRQMAIRQQKKKDWRACQWWAERGLALYGQRAAPEEAVEDLIKRRNRAIAKLDATATPKPLKARSDGPHRTIVAATPPEDMPGTTSSTAELEVLVCQECGCHFDTGFAALLMLLTAVDAGLGPCFFGIPVERIEAYRAAFDVPPQFTPIGAISIGYSDEPPRDLSSRRMPVAETVHRGRWSRPGAGR